MARGAGALAATALLALAAAPARAELAVPALTGPVVDEAGLLDRGDAERLASLSRAARQANGGQGVQLQYLIVRSLEGEPIEDFSIRVAEQWKVGSREQDNGVLVTVAMEDRKVRIEVGGGLEGGLTDAQSSRIIRTTIAPAFQARRYGEGLYQAGVQILGALGALPQGVQARRSPPAVHGSSLLVLLLIVVAVIVRILSGFGVRRRRSLWWGGPFGGWGGGGFGGGRWGGGGGFGGGGGGWGGGGGGFSGGGASGRW